MNSRWGALVAASLAAFAGLTLAWQCVHYDGGENGTHSSLAQSLFRGVELAEIHDIVERQPSAKLGSALNLALPKDARVFMTDMTGPTNFSRSGWYFYMTYYLFPREVGVSVDQPTHITKDGFLGRTSESDQEILTHGFDVRIDLTTDGSLQAKALHDLPIQNPFNPNGFGPDGYFYHSISPDPGPFNPAWFDSDFDLVIAFLLPLLTALAGMWLFRFLFPALSMQMPLPEQLACGLGLGMMAVAALTLGVKLCGFHGRGLILFVTALGSVAGIWRHHKTLLATMAGGYWKMFKSPITIIIWVTGALVFLILFRLAGLQGLVDPDATAWSLKAKIMHLYTGNELVHWFSAPRLASAHLDYPTLVPSLHSATYDSLGHVDEFVTKFWPTWMLLFLIAALASLNRARQSRFHAPSFALLGLLLLPATQKYVQMEGGTLPMIFFTVMGFVQCALWLVGKDPARLGLGLTLLFGAAMAKFEGFIFLALVGSWMLLLPSARPALKPSSPFWRVLGFCFLAALPFVCLRVQIPVLHYESGWAGYALHNPGITLSNWPGTFMIMLARLFVNPDFVNWSAEGERFHWIGKWDGFSSLYNHLTLGLAWLCLLLTVALWFAVPARRQIAVWILAMFLGAVAALSGVFASFVSIKGLSEAANFTQELNGGRYLLPVLLAWFATTLVMLYSDQPSIESTPGTTASDSRTPPSVNPPARANVKP